MENVPHAIFTCRANSHPFQERTVSLSEAEKIGRSVARTRPANNNLVFDCKVLSRNHALLWYENGKFYLKDTKSSNGTFVNNRRLSRGGEESSPNEVNSGDIVQFGVDVIENSRRVTHGCIVSQIRLFMPSGEEANRSEMTLNPNLLDKVHHNLSYPAIQSQDLYQLHHLLQEALHREQMLEQKLAFLQRLITGMQESSEKSWRALIDEDKLLSRLEFLENQLHLHNSKNTSEDDQKTLILNLKEEKHYYEATSNEAMRKALQEKLDVQRKLACLERTFSNTEDECTHLRISQKKTAQELLDLNTKYQQQMTENQKITESLNELKQKHSEIEASFKFKEEELEQKITNLQDDKNNLENLLQELKQRREVEEKEKKENEICEKKNKEIKMKSDENENITCDKKEENELHNGTDHITITETLNQNECKDDDTLHSTEISSQTDDDLSEQNTQTVTSTHCDKCTNTLIDREDGDAALEKFKAELSDLESQLMGKDELIKLSESSLSEIRVQLNNEISQREEILSKLSQLESKRGEEIKLLSSVISELRLGENFSDDDIDEVCSIDDVCKILHEVSQKRSVKDELIIEEKTVEENLQLSDVQITMQYDTKKEYERLCEESKNAEDEIKLIQQLLSQHESVENYDENFIKSSEEFKYRLSQHQKMVESYFNDSLHHDFTNCEDIEINTKLFAKVKESLSNHVNLVKEISSLRLDIVTHFSNINKNKLQETIELKESNQRKLNDTITSMESLKHELSHLNEQQKDNLAVISQKEDMQRKLISIIVAAIAAFLALFFLR